MAKIEFSWGDKQHFHTDCDRIAEIFVRSPDSFIPHSSSVITHEVRTLLLDMLAQKERGPTGYPEIQRVVNSVKITLRTRLFSL